MIVQFGTSRFLQAHVDLFAQEAREAGQDVPSITIVQTSGDAARAARLKGFADPAGFPVILRGLEQGAPVEHTVQVRSVVDGLSVDRDWDAIVALFTGPATHIVSNTGDTGYAIVAEDRTPGILTGDRPKSFPAILLALLHRRWAGGAGGLTLLPCELVQRNGDTLRGLISGLAGDVGGDPAFLAWLEESCIWGNTLVDRIVSEPIEPTGAMAEPYALWAIERQPGLILPFSHPDVVLTDDLEPYERLKLHIPNLGHSWLAERWHVADGAANATVRATLTDAATSDALRRLYAAEIVPGFARRGLAAEAAAYAERTMERFANPFLDHRLADIQVSHAAKVAKRVGGFLAWVDAGEGAPVAMPNLRALAERYMLESVR